VNLDEAQRQIGMHIRGGQGETTAVAGGDEGFVFEFESPTTTTAETTLCFGSLKPRPSARSVLSSDYK
jgi:hypothetical protein